ncbi:MAG: DUF3108 domain-containing protein [Saprospiraceae bacterium]|nr:DUF3108 domain-containing protein [Saprospiraceae bacterium]HMW38248.1 DUF3108 domain-containing protein [Saprospiraceae bacterium]HMX87443.1 DUF3108 domain-containing protein [Saprospiraceae bacterium]HMZ39270.1 DUF3108 domain-containing protein [Saprospiraceae bacterium]HNA63431.1 DUF3108 domain-containing protein [Saprospiraceae bacterium]
MNVVNQKMSKPGSKWLFRYDKIAISGLLLFLDIFPALSSDSPFLPGETIVYKVFYNWNFIWLSAGEVSFEVKDEGDVYHIEVTGKTYTSYEWFYKVRDKFHTYLDKKTLMPRLFIRDIQEGSYQHYEKIVFDYPTQKIQSFVGKSIGTAKKTELPMEDKLYDLISSLYYLRTVDRSLLKSKTRIPFKMILDNEIYKMDITSSEVSKVSVKESGNYQVIKCITQVIAGNVFRSNTSLKVNVGDDDNRLPVLIESPLSVGSVKAVLKTATNLKYPHSSRM